MRRKKEMGLRERKAERESGVGSNPRRGLVFGVRENRERQKEEGDLFRGVS